MSATAPDAVSAIMTNDVTSGLNIHKPEKLVQLWKKNGDQGHQFFMLIETLGWSSPVGQDTYSHFEDARIHETFHVKTEVASPGAGNAALITLAAKNLDAGNRFYPNVGDIVLFPNQVVGRIQSINVGTPSAPVLTVYPNDATDNIGLLTADTELVIISNAYAEGGGQPGGRVRGMYEYDNDAQIIKTTIGASGSELTRDLWVKMWNEGGQFLGWYNATRDNDISYRHSLAISGALLVGKRTTNTSISDTDTNSTGNVLTTEGLIPGIRKRGTLYNIASGAMVKSDFDTMDRAMAKAYAPGSVLVGCGKKRHQNIGNMLSALLVNTNVDYTRREMVDTLFGGGAAGEAKAVAMNFASFSIMGGRTFHISEIGDFLNPVTFGATGHKFEDMAVFIPTAKRKDLKTGEPIPSIGVRYRMLGNYNRRSEVWVDGAAGPGVKIGDLDQTKTYMRSHIGGQFRGLNQMVLVYA